MDLKKLQKIRNKSGIYYLWNLDKIVYIGQSSNMYIRIMEHLIEGIKTFQEISYIESNNITEREVFETLLINKIRPEYNKLVIKDSGIFIKTLPFVCFKEIGILKDDMIKEVDKLTDSFHNVIISNDFAVQPILKNKEVDWTNIILRSENEN